MGEDKRSSQAEEKPKWKNIRDVTFISPN